MHIICRNVEAVPDRPALNCRIARRARVVSVNFNHERFPSVVGPPQVGVPVVKVYAAPKMPQSTYKNDNH